MGGDSTTLCISGLSKNVKKQDIQAAFQDFGHIVRLDNRSGLVFIEYRDKADALDAISEMNGRSIAGCQVQVALADGNRGHGKGEGSGNHHNSMRSRSRSRGYDSKPFRKAKTFESIANKAVTTERRQFDDMVIAKSQSYSSTKTYRH